MKLTSVICALFAALLAGIGWQSTALAQDISKIPPQAVYQAMLDHGKKTGWVAFRNFGGKQLIYFTHLQTMHCRLSEIRYSINSKALDQQFKLVKCNPQLPMSLPGNAGLEEIALSLPHGKALTIAVQVVWDDGRESDVAVYVPCENVGEASCAVLAE